MMEPRESRARLVEAMMRPEFYPDRPATVEMKQTHMSWVFLAGDYVYKVKKPVRFPFADAFTLGARYAFCREEIRLNRRLAPKVYLGVVPIFDHGKHYALGSQSDIYHSGVVEYAVKMRRLPEHRMLDHLVRTGQSGETVAEVTRKLVDFHDAASSTSSLCYGSAAAVSSMVLGNLEECQRFIGYSLSQSEYDSIYNYLRSFLDSNRDLLNERARQGRVREGHGDLRCEHVCMTEEVEIFDCIEFDERLRYCDVASEIAFLAMDLDSLGVPQQADELIDLYAQLSDDSELAALTNFYKCHRACIRGKVGSLKALEPEVPAQEREQARARSRALFALASSYAEQGRPCLLVVCGLAASGKSTIAKMLTRVTGFETFNSDRIRKYLAGIAETAHPKNEYAAGIYSPEFDRLTYETLNARARESLREGRGAILDATFKSPGQRRAVLELGKEFRVPVLFVECRTNNKEAHQRLLRRTAEGTAVSDATVEIYEHQKRDFVSLTELPPVNHQVLVTTQDRSGTLSCLRRALAQMWVQTSTRTTQKRT
jgi:aminoglycoside phosphotransferase family enzyme/predicted kinase